METMRKHIDELDYTELRKLIRKNNYLQCLVFDSMTENNMDYCNEVLRYIKDYVADYEIGACCYNFITVKHHCLFAKGLSKLQNDMGIVNERVLEELNNLIATYKDTYYSSLTEFEIQETEERIKSISQYLADCLASDLEKLFDFDKESIEDYFVDFYAWEKMDDTYYVEDGKLYQTITKELK